MTLSLKRELLDEIDAHGPITFARFMERALYEPERGYYASGDVRAGREFVTGPTLHPVFGWTLARGLAPLLGAVGRPTLVEAGAGGGELTRDVLLALAKDDADLFERLDVRIVDRSEPALARARRTLADAGIDVTSIAFSTELPRAFEGVLVTNELLDAAPVHLCERAKDGMLELFVAEGGGRLALRPDACSGPEVERLAQRLLDGAPAGTRCEVPLAALAWTEAAARSLARGAMVTIDYGATSAEIVAQHPKGSVHGYFEGLRTEEVLANPGSTDLTYLVPFDLVAEEGERAGLLTAWLATQGETLTALGIGEVLRQLTPLDALAGKKLVDPKGAGGTFQVLVQTRGLGGLPWP